MVSTDSMTGAGERSSAESRITFLRPTPAPEITNTSSSESDSDSEDEEMEYMENIEDEQEEQGEMEEEGEGEIEMEGENGPKSKEVPAMNASPTVANATGKRKAIDYRSFRPALCRELYGESDFDRGLMLGSSMYECQLPPLSAAQVEELDQKWTALRIRELELSSARHAWCQEYCQILVEELKRGRSRY